MSESERVYLLRQAGENELRRLDAKKLRLQVGQNFDANKLPRDWSMHRLPPGVDGQGRWHDTYPMTAEAATEVGADDDDASGAELFFRAIACGFAIYTAAILAWLLLR